MPDASNAYLRCTECAARRERGAALIMAILTVALMVSVASAVIAEHGAAIEQLSGRNDQAQARWLARGAVDWARNVLEFDQQRGGGLEGNVDHLREEWAIRVPATPVDEGDVSGEIEDQSARFNLNSLVSNGQSVATQRAIFMRLLDTLRISPRQAEALADAITDWIDADRLPSPQGAERDWYRNNRQSVLPPDAPLIAVNELLAVRGMTPELLALLRPHLTALPPTVQRINVNTASAEVLAAHVERLSLSAAQQIAIGRQRQHFISVSDFTKLLPDGSSYNGALFDVQSRYFLATGRARWGDATTHMQVLLRRSQNRPDILRETIL